MALPSLIDTFAQLLAWKSLLWLSMIRRQRYLTQSHFLSITLLAWSLALHLLFCSVRRCLYGGRKYTHTNTPTSFLVSIQENMNQKKLCIWTFFMQCLIIVLYRKPKLSRHIKLNSSNIASLLQEATQKYRTLTVYWTKCCYLFLPLFLFAAMLPLPFSMAVFSLLGHSLLQNLLKFKTSQVIICAVNTFVFWFKNGLLQVNHS